MIITQFNTTEVDDLWIYTFMFYDKDSFLNRLRSLPNYRPSGHTKLLNNQDQYNKTSFRLHFTME